MILGLHQTQEHGYKLMEILNLHARSSIILNNTGSDKENTPMIDTQTTLTLNNLNITDGTGPEGVPERPTNFVGHNCPQVCTQIA